MADELKKEKLIYLKALLYSYICTVIINGLHILMFCVCYAPAPQGVGIMD